MVLSARLVLSSAVVLSLCLSGRVDLLHAQELGAARPVVAPVDVPPVNFLPDSISPFGEVTVAPDEVAAIRMPKLDGPVTAVDEENFDKYYYFHREDIDVATAFGDISECDGYARGLATSYRYQQAPYPYTYTMAGAIGAGIGNLMAVAIFGSAEKRRMRRVNMRACMGFKGYQRFGLPKNLWEEFNFEEGLDGVSEDIRRKLLLQQALVAAAAVPAGKVLEP